MRYYYQPTIIHFGSGFSSKIGEIAKKYSDNVFFVTTADVEPMKSLHDKVKKYLDESGVSYYHFSKIMPNPESSVIDEALEILNAGNFGAVLAVGGGSSIDAAKAIALFHDCGKVDWSEAFNKYSSPFKLYDKVSEKCLPLISVPTTAGTGSEVTQASVLTHNGEKLTVYHQDMMSDECIVDPALTLTLPVSITASTGFDAFSHAFESYCSANSTELSSVESLNALKIIVHNLPKLIKDPNNLLLREKMSLGALLAGKALSNGGAHAPHPISEIVGGSKIPHGVALSAVYPAFIKVYGERFSSKFDDVYNIFKEYCPSVNEEPDLYSCVVSFLSDIGLNKSFKDLGISESEMEVLKGIPVWDYLPFGVREDFVKVLELS